MPQSPRLIASYFTLAGDLNPFAGTDPSRFDLPSRARAAAEAGYIGLGLETCDVAHAIAVYGTEGIRRIIADAGLDYVELEVLADWFADGERRAASDARREFLLRTAGDIGAAQVKCVGELHLASGEAHITGYPLSQVIDAFGGLCRDAAKVGTRMSIEIVPESGIRDLVTARAIVEGAGEKNGGMLIDIWHMARGGIRYEDILELPAHLITAIELDDANAEQVGTIFEDTINNRRLPGEGDLDVPRFLDVIRRTGYSGVYGVEMVSNEHRARTLEDAARASFDATMAQFAKVVA